MSAARELTVTVSAKVYEGLVRLAKAANTPVSVYAGQLLMAGYSARAKPTGDIDLDAAIARVVVLDAVEDAPVEDIAGFVGLSVPTVKMILKAWHRELAGMTS